MCGTQELEGADSQPVFCVLIDRDRWDKDAGRAWITVSAANKLDAMHQVKVMYPAAAVLTAEAA
jgi:hypothetical protein